MKKAIFIIGLFIITMIIFPNKISAKSTNNQIKVHDYAEILTEENEINLNKKALSFYKKSNIEIIVITLSEKNENIIYNEVNNFYNQNNYNENGIIIIMNKYNETTTLLKKGKMSYTNQTSLLKFKNDIINKSTLNEDFSYTNVLNFIENCNKYYIKKIIKTLIFITIISILITKLIIYKIKQKYNLEEKKEAKNYHNSIKIKYLKGGEYVNKNNITNITNTN